MSDVYDGRPLGRCPRCTAILAWPELTYDDDGVELIEGASSLWCPACGWEEKQ